MPIYEYRCPDCEETFLEWAATPRKRDEIRCPQCGSDKPERLISSFATKSSSAPSSSCGPSFFR
ncbi:MAG: zinc ribbon domain-containing protein [Calditrichaeota bacterium]|nr:zinc ribbon domain-containing protein [Calditrichota bacterium]